jgi:hypothetical protein
MCECKCLTRNNLELHSYRDERLNRALDRNVKHFPHSSNLWHVSCLNGCSFTALQEAIREHVVLYK